MPSWRILCPTIVLATQSLMTVVVIAVLHLEKFHQELIKIVLVELNMQTIVLV